MIEVRCAGVRRARREVLRDVSLSVAPGTVTALIGPNGAGKSTLIGAIAGDYRLATGVILLAGQHIHGYSHAERARLRAVYHAARHSPPGFTAAEIVAMGRPGQAGEAMAAAMRATDTVHLAERTFAMLSDGERARVSLARVFSQRSPVLLLDEPTASLDVKHQYGVLQHIRREALGGASVLVAVHDINQACQFADRIAMMKDGAVVAEGLPTKVIESSSLTRVFDYPMQVVRHPNLDVPLVIPQPGGVR